MEPGANRLELGQRLGADATVNVRGGDPVAAVKRIVGEQGAGLVIETSGESGTPQECAELVTHRFLLDQIVEDFRVVRERIDNPIKVVFVP